MEITPGMKNEWVAGRAKAAEPAQARRREFFAHIAERAPGAFSFISLLRRSCVCRSTIRVEIQGVALAKLHAALKKSYASNQLHQGAINYEKELDEIHEVIFHADTPAGDILLQLLDRRRSARR